MPTSILTGLAGLMLPTSGHALPKNLSFLEKLPFDVSSISTTHFVLGGLLLFTMLLLVIFLRRFTTVSRELRDVGTELDTTRQRLTDTSLRLEKTQTSLTETSKRHESILSEANVGIFKMDIDGTCIDLNKALQDMSGLYPKKALKEGLESAIHPEDQPKFKDAWEAFTEHNKPFSLRFRFRRAKSKEIHVHCAASKVLNRRKETEYYIGWITDITRFHEDELKTKAITSRYEYFMDETVESYYQLTPEEPIPLDAASLKMARSIMDNMKLAACNDTFAAMYGSTPEELTGKALNELQAGCGPLKNLETIKEFIENGYRAIDLESIRQDPSGNRLNLLNNTVGLIEDNKLVGIWGAQRNTSQQKREKTELTNQVQFMQRILDSLPADIYVKDTRCRYLYASQKLAERTGIPQEDWIGKTIFEVMPATPREHDKSAIEVMKNSQMTRIECPFELHGKPGWMETILSPLVSDEELVEGVVGLSVDMSTRKKREEQVSQRCTQLDQQLQNRTTELQQSQCEHGQTATALSEAIQNLKVAEAEHAAREHKMQSQLEDHKRSAEILRSNETHLLARQKELETQLGQRLSELDTETQKRIKWEELLVIKENALCEIEKQSSALGMQLKEETTLREQVEADLASSQVAQEEYRQKLESLVTVHKKEVSSLNTTNKEELKAEQQLRESAEKQRKKVEALLLQTQEQIKQKTEQHAEELKHEVAERKAATENLIQSMDELDKLKQQFSIRIEEETSSIKQELAKKQIHEKALRQQEKELESRIKELEKNLQLKVKAHAQEIQAREEETLHKQQAEQQVEQLKQQQASAIAREKQKIDLSIAEIRLDEVKLRKQIDDLEQEKLRLGERLDSRNAELAAITKKQRGMEVELAEARDKLSKLTLNHEKVLTQKTGKLENQLSKLEQTELGLRQKSEQQQKQMADLQKTILKLQKEMETETRDRTQIEEQIRQLEEDLETSKNKTRVLSEQHQEEIQEQEEQNRNNESVLKQEIESLLGIITEREEELVDIRQQRETAEERTKEIEILSENLKREYENELTASNESVRAVTGLIGELSTEAEQALINVAVAAGTIEEAENLLPNQKQELENITYRCDKLVNIMNCSNELTRLKTEGEALEYGACDLHNLIKELEQKFCHRAETKKLFFAISYAHQKSVNSVPCHVETDEQKVCKVLSMLLDYALEHTRKGRLGLHATCKAREGDTARIAFDMAYTGVQRNDTALAQVFSPDEAEETNSSNSIELSLVKEYIDLLGGEIRVEFREGGITVVTTELPFREIADESAKDEPTAGAA
jgi:PAS domain S-box-containing protein